ncbi:TetR/AcrR family transcriptional regulator [Mycolicibacterium sp. P9-22]|uniref:TetR/AcrR family transcriptional regulator n=1 Tax=Mycolicibacterium sp. P9-22 TaxID=2024613 RepID=UPI0018833D5C|nr:TetR family transcriptional regulator C-terminal domain-containing protein [Mycolicibacterium sp. P9-22]
MARVLEDDVREEQRQRLLDSAIRAISKHGFDTVRLRDIASDAGVTTGMIQYYFDSRQSFLTAALEKVGLDQIEWWSRIGEIEADPWKRITMLIGACADPNPTVAVEQSAAWLEFCACATRHLELRDILSAVNRRWRDVVLETIQTGTASGAFRPVLDEALIADALIAMLDGCEMSIGSQAGLFDSDQARSVATAVAQHLLNCAPADRESAS